MGRRPAIRALVVLALAALAAVSPAPAHAQVPSLEAPVKATFLYRFGDFVDWPAAAFTAAGAAINLCIVGDDPFGEVLDLATSGQRAHGRPISLYRLDTLTAGDACHIAYLAGSPQQSVGEALAAVAGAPVLTVTDAEQGDDRGTVHFEIVDDRVKFHVDEQAAARDGLTISSRLLDIALTVRRRAGP